MKAIGKILRQLATLAAIIFIAVTMRDFGEGLSYLWR